MARSKVGPEKEVACCISVSESSVSAEGVSGDNGGGGAVPRNTESTLLLLSEPDNLDI